MAMIECTLIFRNNAPALRTLIRHRNLSRETIYTLVFMDCLLSYKFL